MVSVLLRGKLRAWFLGYAVAKHRRLAFELARLVIGTDKVGDLART